MVYEPATIPTYDSLKYFDVIFLIYLLMCMDKQRQMLL